MIHILCFGGLNNASEELPTHLMLGYSSILGERSTRLFI